MSYIIGSLIMILLLMTMGLVCFYYKWVRKTNELKRKWNHMQELWTLQEKLLDDRVDFNLEVIQYTVDTVDETPKQIEDSWNLIENEVVSSFNDYNASVVCFNQWLLTFPIKITASLLGLESLPQVHLVKINERGINDD